MAHVAEAMQAQIVVVGAGLVGAAAALALTQNGWHVVLVDGQPATSAPTPTGWDQRIYAITPGNQRWLDSLGIWQCMDSDRICKVERMQVWGDDMRSSLTFDAYEASLPSLGFILEARQLEQALLLRLQALGVIILPDSKVEALSFGGGQPELMLAGGQSLKAPLIVAADGGNSVLRQYAGLATMRQAYDELGVVANFACELPHGLIARQWFREDGVLAWLPLPGNRISMVWSTRRHEELLSMDEASLCQTVAAAGAGILGDLRLIGRPAAFPLNLQSTDRLVMPGFVLAGDAAHQVHPLAGQGVNLGFRDVIQLVNTLAGRRPHEALGDLMLLRRYERARKIDLVAMRYITHGLHELFAQPQSLIRRLRNFGLDLTNRQGWLKKQLIKHATT
ncbi:MAG TPA: FAD-dependent oxidoreductase [Methylophilaceae bacterium]|nr:FAD-dependent oxidoreductase [Methylophilaceae bacterium]